MRTVSLFSGCGGMDIGATSAGAEVVYASDVMTEAALTYRAQFPEVEFVHSDIKSVDTWPDADLVVGGYPCQSFSLGGKRRPQDDHRTQLYVDFARAVDAVNPRFFVAENVSGLRSVQGGVWLREQLELFGGLGRNGGYNLSYALLKAEEYGVPQKRRRLFIVGVRKDLGLYYEFAAPTHGSRGGLLPFASHGDAIGHLPAWPTGEFYERPHDPEGHWSWYYMSRNRKARWADPSFTVVANWRHTTLHPASPIMTLTWSNLADGFKQRWDFQEGQYEHLEAGPDRMRLETPRRLSWREAALIQTFPQDFEPSGSVERKFEQIGNAVPPKLAEAVIRPLIDGSGLVASSRDAHVAVETIEQPALF